MADPNVNFKQQNPFEKAHKKIKISLEYGDSHFRLCYTPLAQLPPEIGQLTKLSVLSLTDNRLTTLPREIGQLKNLKVLCLQGNQLNTLPIEMGALVNLQALYLQENQLSKLPPVIGLLTNLTDLHLDDNELSELPPWIVELPNLKTLSLLNNPLKDPPLTVCSQGLNSMRQYFEDKLQSGTQVLWRSKLMLVGQGRVGKTELRHRLMKRPHGQAASTEVVEIENLSLPHPQQAGVNMELRCWDFGGQDIYHATHQFFLTGRSLFLFCFEAGKDWEAGKPYYWLDKITAVAPDSPVVVVATKCDERPAPALPWEDLKKRYPQIVGDGCFTVTTKEKDRKDQSGDGIPELIACLQKVAADRQKLPLMGELLPKVWVAGMSALANHPNDHYLRREVFYQILTEAGVTEASIHPLAKMLRDLGEILYYCDDADATLRDWVIIKPTWVTHAAARILDSVEVENNDGILTQAEMLKAWKDYPLEMHPVLLELLEKYDLTYKIPDDPTERSLVVEKLPKKQAVAPEIWESLRPTPDGPNREMKMVIRLASMQAGIPTWFMARKHYYTLHKHWLYGVYFGDNRKAPHHVALVHASTDPKTPEVELTVRGPCPQTFFAIMKEGLEKSIQDRYPKLIQAQLIPCCCQDKKRGAAPCTYYFNYERLWERLAKDKHTAECDVSQEDVSVAELLFGYNAPTESTLERLNQMEDQIVGEVQRMSGKMEHMAAVMRDSFRYLYDDFQQREESHCPNLFVIWKAEKGKPFHVPLRLALVCQHPGEEHIACKPSDAYHVNAMDEHLRKALPLMKRVASVLKYAKIAGLSPLKEWDKEIGEAIGEFQEGINEMLEDFEKVAAKGEAPRLLVQEIDTELRGIQEKRVAGAAMREFRALLDFLDKEHHWHGLEKKKSNLTGAFLWVCKEHAARLEYNH